MTESNNTFADQLKQKLWESGVILSSSMDLNDQATMNELFCMISRSLLKPDEWGNGAIIIPVHPTEDNALFSNYHREDAIELFALWGKLPLEECLLKHEWFITDNFNLKWEDHLRHVQDLETVYKLVSHVNNTDNIYEYVKIYREGETWKAE